MIKEEEKKCKIISRKSYDNIFKNEIIFKINNSQKKENQLKLNRNEKNNQIIPNEKNCLSQKILKKNFDSSTYDLKALSIKKKYQFNNSINKKKKRFK